MKCLICDKEFLKLGMHIKKFHNISVKDYYDRYIRNYSIDEGFCLTCGKETSIRDLNGYSKYCSSKCAVNNKKYIEKRKHTCIEKYGVENPSQCKKIKEKKIKTCLEKYGVENPYQSDKIKEKIKHTCLERFGVKYSFQSKIVVDKIRESRLKNNNIGSKGGFPLFNFYVHKISWVEETRKTKNGYLEVRCKKCNKWFVPKIIDLKNRIATLNNQRGFTQNNFYCSSKCKNSCSIFNRSIYREGQNTNIDRPYHQEWALEVKRIANYECEICGSRKSLEAHHIEPVKLRPDLQADIDNGVCLCKDCHMKYGHKDECSTGNLAKRIC